jgi:phosphatidylglycerophosphate synthase
MQNANTVQQDKTIKTMLDSKIRPIIDPPLNGIANLLAKTPLTGTMLTIIGFLFGFMACMALLFQTYWLAVAGLILNRVCDGMDGALARARGEASDLGGYLDITLDFLIYAGIPFFAAVGLMEASAYFAASFVIYSFIGTGISFLAFAIVADKRKMDDKSHQGKKSFYFANGFMEGTETIIFMALICLLPQYFEYLCYGFGTLCWITTFARIHMASQLFK